MFIAEPILKIYTLSLLTVVKTDALDFVLGVYLVIYYSHKITPLELNYNIYNKELLGIVAVLKE